MKLLILILEFYFKIIALVIQGIIYAVSAVCMLIAGIFESSAQKKRSKRIARTTVTSYPSKAEKTGKAAAAARKKAIDESVGYAFADESNSYYVLASELSCKASKETDRIKRAKLQQQAATARRKAEQFASKSPDYLAH